jgi:hypothetical protein
MKKLLIFLLLIAAARMGIAQVNQFDIVIDEIMADPDPKFHLPNAEYLELYNRTSHSIDLTGWSVKIGTSSYSLSGTLDSSGYLFITKEKDSFPSYNNVLELSSLSSTAMVNGGTTISLIYQGDYIHSVTYSDSWYQNSSKADGGWSLEMIDPKNPCGGAENWSASTGPLGGTPGWLNSINGENIDHVPPQIYRVYFDPGSSDKLYVYFTENLGYLNLLYSKYSFSDPNITVTTVTPTGPDYSSAVLTISGTIQPDITYTITLLDTLTDCAGNLMPANSSARFGLSKIPVANDLIINEVLSHPSTDGEQYVELYNHSNKIIDLKDLQIADSLMLDMNDIAPGGYLVFPEQYIVLSTNPDVVKKQYYTPNSQWFVEIGSMPDHFNNDDGAIVLALKADGTIIDRFVYNKNMYFPLLNSQAGVAFERISFTRPTSDKTNWHSAAETVGFGTPAYKNSQYSEAVTDDGAVKLSPDIFSPDNDGYNDVLNIAYTFAEPGYTANINIYNSNGRPVRKLITNELLGTAGVFSWDGTTDDNEKAVIGIYIIYFEVFDLKGDVKRYKKATVLGGKFK